MGRKQTFEQRKVWAEERDTARLEAQEAEVRSRVESISDLPQNVIKLLLQSDLQQSRRYGRLTPREQFDNMVAKVRQTLKVTQQ